MCEFTLHKGALEEAVCEFTLHKGALEEAVCEFTLRKGALKGKLQGLYEIIKIKG